MAPSVDHSYYAELYIWLMDLHARGIDVGLKPGQDVSALWGMPSDAIWRFLYQFHQENPRVFAAYESIVLSAMSRGETDTIARHYENTRKALRMKLSDHLRSRYARLFLWQHPEFHWSQVFAKNVKALETM